MKTVIVLLFLILASTAFADCTKTLQNKGLIATEANEACSLAANNKINLDFYLQNRLSFDSQQDAIAASIAAKEGAIDANFYLRTRNIKGFWANGMDSHNEAMEAAQAVKQGSISAKFYLKVRIRWGFFNNGMDSHREAMAACRATNNNAELEKIYWQIRNNWGYFSEGKDSSSEAVEVIEAIKSGKLDFACYFSKVEKWYSNGLYPHQQAFNACNK